MTERTVADGGTTDTHPTAGTRLRAGGTEPSTGRSTRTDPAPLARHGRAWAWSGVGAGLLGLVSIASSMMLGVAWEETAGDADAIVADLAGRLPNLLVFHTATTLAMVLVLVFAAGLKRRLDVQAPAGSLLPTLAGWGLVLVAVAALLGSGLDTQYMFGFADPVYIVPETGAMYADWVATIPWLWVGAGISGVALGVAALRHAAAPRWIGLVGILLGGLTLLVGISPLQYGAGFFGPLWLVVTAAGFALGDRR